MTPSILTGDELAGVVDLFGALTRTELERALDELAFKRGEATDAAAVAGGVDDALGDYYLVAVDHGTERLIAPGPTAFPDLPTGAEDLPHILDVPDRDVDREALVATAERRFRTDAADAVAAGDADRIERLLDVSYDLETWGSADLTELRRRLERALENRN